MIWNNVLSIDLKGEINNYNLLNPKLDIKKKNFVPFSIWDVT